MPLDFTPRSSASPSSVPSGITAPGRATATIWPAATLGAPHTIVRGAAEPSSTRHTRQPVGVRVRLGLQHPADDEARRVAHAHAVDPRDLERRRW